MKAKIFSVIAAAGMSVSLIGAPAIALTTTDRAAVERSAPEYPRGAERRGIEGSVTVSYAIDADGSVVDAQIVESTPAGVFDRAALAAIETWRYEASEARTEGHTYSLDFRLGQ
ncbi:MAG: energy transducer TonB [Maricaulis sp.]|jgi:protein TonB|uniref:energy transducer TonB n=1 Tax=Maricaulis sp. TaxID=1486257 RepID=UPI0025B9E7A5|nr:energy transducer TonB [Maricaulis sp.]MDM7983795.1 energy transducer TonB [Maricaulis sp.]